MFLVILFTVFTKRDDIIIINTQNEILNLLFPHNLLVFPVIFHQKIENLVITLDFIVTMSWTVQSGIIVGMTPTTLNPADGATRAQVALVLVNYLKLN